MICRVINLLIPKVKFLIRFCIWSMFGCLIPWWPMWMEIDPVSNNQLETLESRRVTILFKSILNITCFGRRDSSASRSLSSFSFVFAIACSCFLGNRSGTNGYLTTVRQPKLNNLDLTSSRLLPIQTNLNNTLEWITVKNIITRQLMAKRFTSRQLTQKIIRNIKLKKIKNRVLVFNLVK